MKKKVYGKSLAIATVLFGGLALVWQTRARTDSSQHYSDEYYSVEATSLDFGEAWESDQFDWDFTVTNKSSEPVEVRGFRKSCACISIEPQNLLLVPGQPETVRIRLNLRSRNSAPESRDFGVEIEPAIFNRNGEVLKGVKPWVVHGKIRRVLWAEPPHFRFGKLSNLTLPLPQSIQLKSAVPFASLAVTTTRPDWSASAICASNASTDWIVTVVPPTRLEIGRIDCTVDLTPELANGDSLPPHQLRVEGEVVHDVQANTSWVILGPRRLEEVAEERIWLYSLTNQSFDVVKIATSSQHTSAKQDTRGPTAHSYVVRQKIAGKSIQSESIRFHVHSAGRSTIVPVTIKYIGMVD